MRSHIKAGMAASLAMALTIPGFARAQSTALTYQGRLKNGAAPATGLHDFRFTLFNVPSGGVQIAPPQCVDDVPVTGGLFTTPIDFGQQFTTPDPRFLEIEVRADTGLACGTATGFVVLTPRQPLTAAPIANHARSAFTLAAADGSPANAVFVDNAGKVGIGTGAPIYPVHIASPEPALALQDTDSQQVGYVDYRDSGNVSRAWVGFGLAGDPDFSIINARPLGDIVLNTLGGGDVGIGTAAPLAKLDVRGDIRLGASGQFFAPAGDENLRVIRGKVGGNGALIAGSGFSSVRTSVGQYTITFSPPFAGVPIMVGSPEVTLPSTGFNSVFIDPVNSGQFNVILLAHNGSGAQDGVFVFIATGQR